MLSQSIQAATSRVKRKRPSRCRTRATLTMVLFACLSQVRIRALPLTRESIHLSQRVARTLLPVAQTAFASYERLHSSPQLFASFQDTASEIAPYLEGLNPAQVEVVTQPLSSITRVVAGPGAGKTRVLTSRIAHLLNHDEENRHILAVTFTRKAAGEMQERLEKLLLATSIETKSQSQHIPTTDDEVFQEDVAGDGASARPSTALDRVTLGTFHSVCAKILRWNGRLLSELPTVTQDMTGSVNATILDGSFAIADQSEQVRLIKECVADLGIDLKNQDLKPQAILNALGKIKANLALGKNPPKDGRKIPSKALRVAAKIYPLYRQKLLSRNSLDFDDLILTTRELLIVHEDVRDRLRRRWPFVLVDEFQDTSKTQLDLVKLLSSDSLLVVGDADQSIYSWRGAHVESMSDFLHEFDDRLDGVRTVYLMENYRSTTNIVSAAQKIISHDDSSSKQTDLRQDMKPMRGSGPKPRVLACADAKAEASFVVKTIQEMIAVGDLTPDSSVAVVYRTNAQSRALEEACVQANLPYVVRGSAGSFYKRAEIQDCLCFLRLLHNGRDEAAMKRAIKTPSRGIGNVAYQEFRQYCTQVEDHYQHNRPNTPTPTPLDVLISFTDEGGFEEGSPPPSDTMSKRALNRFLPFSMQMRQIREAAHKLTVAELLNNIINELDLRSHIDSISKSKAEFSDRWSNVIELRQAAQRYSNDGASLKEGLNDDGGGGKESDSEQPADFEEMPLGNFVDDVALVADISEDLDGNGGADKRLVANLMTIHASKGMEFDSVFLVGNEDGTLPGKLAIMEGERSVALDEEKRLCYVAMTRAKTNLIMTWRREVSSFNGNTFTTTKAKRSRFLDILVGKGGTKESKSKSGEKLSQPKRRRLTDGRRTRTNGQRANSSLPRAGVTRPPRARAEARPELASNTRTVQSKRPSSNTNTRRASSSVKAQRKPPAWTRSTIPDGVIKARNGSEAKPAVKANKHVAKGDEKMDSSWFYPIGSSVIHARHGRGMILPPPPDQNGEMMVRVQFEDGTRQELSANGNELHLNFD